MRNLILAVALVLPLGAAAYGQSTSTTTSSNQDVSNTPAQQSMQEVGGSGGANISVVVQGKVKPVRHAPKPSAIHHRQTVVRTKGAGPATPHASAHN